MKFLAHGAYLTRLPGFAKYYGAVNELTRHGLVNDARLVFAVHSCNLLIGLTTGAIIAGR
jgi:hypothetical protein